MGEQAVMVSDAELVERAKAGDADALHELVSRHHAAVFRTVLGMLRDDDAAADATQEAFVKALRALQRFRGDSSFKTWIMAIAVNEARGWARRRGRRRERPLESHPEIPGGEQGVAERVVVTDEVARVRAALETLPDKQRMAVSLRIFEGLSFREVGALIDSTEGAARVNYHHGIKRLRELLK